MFIKKCDLKIGDKLKWFPRAVTPSKQPVDTQELAERITEMNTASPGDVHLMLRCLPTVMDDLMNTGLPIHIEWLDSFHFKLSCVGRGVDSPEEVSLKLIKFIRVQFLPETQRSYGKRIIRPMVQNVELISLDGR